MTFKRLKILLPFLLCPFLLIAQSEGPNAWVTLDVSKGINKWDFNAEFELRSIGFFEKNQRTSIQLQTSYEITKVLEAGVSYALMNFYDDKYSDYQLRNRYSLILQGKKKINRFSFNLREKLELTSKDESDRIKRNGEIDTYRINPELVWRNRLKASYDIPNLPLSPAISAETFYLMNDPDGNAFEKIRYTFGIEYKLNKHNSFEVFTLYNHELIEEEISSYVIGVGYKLNL